jgi:hypothetical protein
MKTTTATKNPTVTKAKADAAAALKKSAALKDAVSALAPAPASERPPSQNRHALKVVAASSDDAEAIAKKTVAAVLSPSVGAGLAALALTHKYHDATDHPSFNLSGISKYFTEAAVTAANGDLGPLQQMLAVQARTLDHVFCHFLQLAGNAKLVDRQEQCMRLAMKAQAQSRNTVESLATIQMGPAIFARQANINQGGQQQVNNAVDPNGSRARAAKPELANRTIEGGNHG